MGISIATDAERERDAEVDLTPMLDVVFIKDHYAVARKTFELRSTAAEII